MFSNPFVYLSKDLLIYFTVSWWIYQLVGHLIYCLVVSREYVNGGDHDHDKHFHVDFFSQTLFKWDTLHDDNLRWALHFHATTDTDLV